MNSFNVIVVDDEYLIRKGICSMIDWNELNCNIIGESSNGQGALDLIKNCDVDIVITDIKMPVLDGLELIKQSMKLDNKPHFLVLSNFNDFDYVRDALKLGAEDYLLKLELQPQELFNAINSITNKIMMYKDSSCFNYDSLSNDNIKTLRDNLFRDIIFRKNMDKSDLSNQFKILGINHDLNKKFYSMIIKTGELFRFEDIGYLDLYSLEESVINTTEEILSEWYDVICFQGKTGEFIVIATSNSNHETFTNTELTEQGTLLREMLKQYLNIDAVLSIGKGESGITGIYDSYNSALLNLNNRFFADEKEILLFKKRDLPMKSHSDFSLIYYKQQLFDSLNLQNRKELISFFNISRKRILSRQFKPADICNFALEILSMVREYEEIYQTGEISIFNKSRITHKEILCMNHLYDFTNWLDDLKTDLENFMTTREQNKGQKLLNNFKTYIHENYNQELSLSSVAQKFKLNPSYFSTVIKSGTGMCFSEYITMERINHAKIMLQNSDMKIYEISELVGYENVYYFNRVFKKNTNLTPGDFRNLIPSLRNHNEAH